MKPSKEQNEKKSEKMHLQANTELLRWELLQLVYLEANKWLSIIDCLGFSSTGFRFCIRY